MKTMSCLVLITLACLGQKTHADTLCMRECPSQCMKKNTKHSTEAHDIECYYYCVLTCEKCPNSPTGCPPDKETSRKLAAANMKSMKQMLIKTHGTRKLKD